VKLSLAIATAAYAALGAVPAHAAGDAAAGHALARQWCSGCHVVDNTGEGQDVAPPFASIARREAGNSAWVRAWLAAPHPSMPNFNLARPQIDNIIAYLESLTPPR
jgi:mono/diheme cytochrome c family protein